AAWTRRAARSSRAPACARCDSSERQENGRTKALRSQGAAWAGEGREMHARREPGRQVRELARRACAIPAEAQRPHTERQPLFLERPARAPRLVGIELAESRVAVTLLHPGTRVPDRLELF